MIILAQKLKEIRSIKEMTQQEMACDLGINLSTYKMWEAGLREPPLDFLVGFCDKFGTSLDYLLGRSDSVGNPRNLGSFETKLSGDDLYQFQNIAEALSKIAERGYLRDLGCVSSIQNLLKLISQLYRKAYVPSDIRDYVEAEDDVCDFFDGVQAFEYLDCFALSGRSTVAKEISTIKSGLSAIEISLTDKVLRKAESAITEHVFDPYFGIPEYKKKVPEE